jgi:hypothetical protein
VLAVFASFAFNHLMHCIMLPLAHVQLFYALDQVHVEPESEAQAEQAQVEAITNLDLDQGKPPILDFYFWINTFMLRIIVY